MILRLAFCLDLIEAEDSLRMEKAHLVEQDGLFSLPGQDSLHSIQGKLTEGVTR